MSARLPPSFVVIPLHMQPAVLLMPRDMISVTLVHVQPAVLPMPDAPPLVLPEVSGRLRLRRR